MKPTVIFISIVVVLISAGAGFAAEPAAITNEPEELVKLRDQYESAVEKATAPITAQYKRSLESLVQRFTQTGNKPAAQAVQAELDLLAERTSDLTNPSLTILEATWAPTIGKSVDVTKKLQALTADNKLQLKAGEKGTAYYKLFGNPQPIVTKYLTVSYKYAGKKKKVRFSQFEDVNIP